MEHEFQKNLRAALNHLYNLDQLRKNPLIGLLNLSDRFDAPSVLQHILIDAIEEFRPPQSVPLHSELRKTFEILQFRYVQQFKQDEVAHHLGVSDRQFRREQDNALEIFSLSLWNKYSNRIESLKQPLPSTQMLSTLAKEPTEEWNWLKKARSERIVNLIAFIGKIIQLMDGVARQNNTHLDWIEPQSLPDLAVHPIAFRQILLNLIQIAIHKANGNRVQINAEHQPPFVQLQVISNLAEPDSLRNYQVQDSNLEGIATHLSTLCGGRLSIFSTQKQYAFQLLLPAVQGVPILVIDDNNEIIELLQRYTAATRYNLTGSNDPEQAIDLAIDSGAKIIIIDVMMPKIDGWELLGRLRSHPKTAEIPIIVLTILAQEDLAFSLGASALLLKPITQEAFLSALDAILSNLN